MLFLVTERSGAQAGADLTPWGFSPCFPLGLCVPFWQWWSLIDWSSPYCCSCRPQGNSSDCEDPSWPCGVDSAAEGWPGSKERPSITPAGAGAAGSVRCG